MSPPPRGLRSGGRRPWRRHAEGADPETSPQALGHWAHPLKGDREQRETKLEPHVVFHKDGAQRRRSGIRQNHFCLFNRHNVDPVSMNIVTPTILLFKISSVSKNCDAMHSKVVRDGNQSHSITDYLRKYPPQMVATEKFNLTFIFRKRSSIVTPTKPEAVNWTLKRNQPNKEAPSCSSYFWPPDDTKEDCVVNFFLFVCFSKSFNAAESILWASLEQH